MEPTEDSIAKDIDHGKIQVGNPFAREATSNPKGACLVFVL
jgi:hypothetical protein